MYFVKKIEKWKLSKWWEIKQYIEWLKDWIYSIRIEKRWDRTLQQNALYRQILTIISKETGNSPQELHYYFKNLFIYSENWFPSSRKLNKEEFSEYLEKIKNKVALLGINIPEYEL